MGWYFSIAKNSWLVLWRSGVEQPKPSGGIHLPPSHVQPTTSTTSNAYMSRQSPSQRGATATPSRFMNGEHDVVDSSRTTRYSRVRTRHATTHDFTRKIKITNSCLTWVSISALLCHMNNAHLNTVDTGTLLVLVNTATRQIVDRCPLYATCSVTYDDAYLPSCGRCGEAMRPLHDKAEMVNVYNGEHVLVHAEPCSMEMMHMGRHTVDGHPAEYTYA